MNFLDVTGLSHLWERIKGAFAPIVPVKVQTSSSVLASVPWNSRVVLDQVCTSVTIKSMATGSSEDLSVWDETMIEWQASSEGCTLTLNSSLVGAIWADGVKPEIVPGAVCHLSLKRCPNSVNDGKVLAILAQFY